jgi:hypothetical protein
VLKVGFSAKTRNSEGIVSVGTNALLTNVNGKTTINRAQFAVSLLLTIDPNIAESKEIASKNSIKRPNTKSHSRWPARKVPHWRYPLIGRCVPVELLTQLFDLSYCLACKE